MNCVDPRLKLDLASDARLSSSEIGEPSLADLLLAITQDAELPDDKRRHWPSSIRFIARALARPPERLPARLTALRTAVSKLVPAASSVTDKTLSNHKSNLRAALAYFRKDAAGLSRGAPLAVEWTGLFSRILEVKAKRLIYGLARYCSSRGLHPEHVSLETVGAYSAHRHQTSFLETGTARQRELIRAWNRCCEVVPGWQGMPLALPELDSKLAGPDWCDFPEGLQQDVDAYLSSLGKSHLSANGRRRKACKNSTVETRRRELVSFARTAVRAGVPIDSITSLATLLATEIAMLAFEAYLDQGGEKAKTYVIDLAWKLVSIAKAIEVPDETHLTLKDIQARLEDDRGPALTDKNLTVIRAILMGDVWRGKVIPLPEQLLREAEFLHNRSPAKARALADRAIQILILTRAPIRVGNLMQIRLGHNLTRPGGEDTPYLLSFPEYDVKNRIDVVFPLSSATSLLIDRYLQHFHSCSRDGAWLFGTEDGNKRSSSHASGVRARLATSC